MVPANESQAKIPYARVNHNKYMVTDKVAYIGEWLTMGPILGDGESLPAASAGFGTRLGPWSPGGQPDKGLV